MRTVSRLDAPLDASPKLTEKIRRIQLALETHGTFNTYYLHNAACIFHLTNDVSNGLLEFEFEGTLFTDAEDVRTARTDLTVTLVRENCSWLNQQIVDWMAESVRHAITVEFNRYVEAGDLAKTQQRLEQIEKSVDDQQGYLGMYL
jgi:hypothetical protein